MKYQGEFSETFQVAASPDRVRQQFLDLDQVIAHYGDLDSADRVDDQTLRFVLTEQNQGVFTFQGRYDCRYQPQGDDGVSWDSVPTDDANIETTGKLTVREGDSPGSSVLDYSASMTLDIEVNKMLAPMLKPVVEAAIAHQMKDYVKRMLAAAEAGG